MNELKISRINKLHTYFTDNTTILHKLIVHYELTYDKLNYMLFILIT